MKTKISAMGLAYAVNKDQVTCRITGIGVYEKEHLLIPDSLDGYPVTSIAKEAFLDRAELISAEIADGVTVIGAEAFRGCSRLACVKIADTVTEIGWGAFLDCASLSSLSLGRGVQEIAACAFRGCPAKMEIPAGVTSIGEQAFLGTSEIAVSEKNPRFVSVDGNLYTSDGKTLLQYAVGKQDPVFRIPDAVTEIGSFAFGGAERLSAVRFGRSVKSIGSNAFHGCTSLWAAVLPDGARSIGDSAFYGCTSLSVVSVDNGMQRIGRGAFDQCPKLSRIHRRGKKPIWQKVLFGKKRGASFPLCEIQCKNLKIKFLFPQK